MKYGLSVNPELQSVSSFPGGLLGDLSSPAPSAELPGKLEECWEKQQNRGLQMKKTARKTKGTQGLERKEAKKPREQGAPARVFI